MITFSLLGQFGRLGNVLWQYAALRGISLKLGYEMKIPNTADYTHHGQNCLLECFNIKRNYLTPQDTITHRYTNMDHAQLFDPNVYTVPDGTDLLSYFQNLRYFEGYEDIILRELQPNSTFVNPAKKYLEQLKEYVGGKPIVSVHVRRGDVIGQAQSHNFDIDTYYNYYFNDWMNIIRNLVGTDVHYLVFTGGNRGENLNEDMEWCKANLKGKNIHYCCGQPTMMDFTIMSLCDHHINCLSTSFGWWASYINHKPGQQIVITPKCYHWRWLQTGLPDFYKIEEFYPTSWTVVD